MSFKNIIFDLGGVIMNIDFALTEKAFADLGFAEFKTYMTQFHITPFFEEYEVGKINDAAFIRGIQELASRPVTAQQVVGAWNALLLDFPTERIALLERLKSKYRLFLLSNTNSLHQAAFEKTFYEVTGKQLGDIFEKLYYSHTAHLRKPHREIFQLVIDENALIPAETLFIDDSRNNLVGAEQAGIQTIHLAAPTTILDLSVFKES